MSSSGFLEIEGGVQPALPTTGRSRLWFDTATNDWYVTLPDGTSKRITLPANAQFNQILSWNGTTWAAKDPILDTRRVFYAYEDFVSQSGAGDLNLRNTNSGGGISTTDYGPFSNLGNRAGIIRLQASTANNSRSAVDVNGTGLFILNDGITVFRASVFLSTGTLNPSNFRVGMWGFGLNGNQGVLNFTRGCYFKIRPQTNGSNIIAVCSESNVHTEVNMGPISETTWYTYEIEINSVGPAVVFRVFQEGQTTPLYTQTITSNVPLGVNNLLEPVLYMSTQGGNGTAISYLYCDYFEMYKFFNSIR